MALSGVMPLWPGVLSASPEAAPQLLQAAARQILELPSLLLVSGCALVLMQLCRWLWQQGEVGRITSSALATTLAVDGLCLVAALAAPRLSGLI
jgi:hypothetical protein